MGFELTSKDYADYLKRAYDAIHEKGDYITELDSATGDGDHFTNLDMGFLRLVEAADSLEKMEISDEFKEIGTIMMSVIGGSSGVLYGSAYLAAARALKGKEVIGYEELCTVLEEMQNAVTKRGKAEPGWKTMLDALAPAVDCYKECIAEGVSEREMTKRVRKAALDGAESTRQMEAVRGRATYQANKGVGHLDPGAVTMSYQIAALMDCVEDKLNIMEELS